MKKNSVLAIIAMAILVTTVAVVSCKKEKQEQTSNNTEQSVQSSNNMDAYLISFKEKLLSAEKGGELISLEQAERDLGDLLNFDFGDANYPTDVNHFDTIHANLTLSNGYVELSQLAETYTIVINQILDAFNKIDLPEKTVQLITCNFKESTIKESNAEDIEIVLITRGYTGEDEATNGDLWRPTNLGGTCDGYLIGHIGAPEVVVQALNNTIGTPICPFGVRVYYTDHASSILLGQDTHVGIPPYDYYNIYYSTNPNQNTICISDVVLNDYKNNILDYWTNGGFTPVKPLDHILTGWYIQFVQLNNNAYTWNVTAYHAKPNCTDNPPIID
jgi:hypothetical protein